MYFVKTDSSFKFIGTKIFYFFPLSFYFIFVFSLCLSRTWCGTCVRQTQRQWRRNDNEYNTTLFFLFVIPHLMRVLAYGILFIIFLSVCHLIFSSVCHPASFSFLSFSLPHVIPHFDAGSKKVKFRLCLLRLYCVIHLLIYRQQVNFVGASLV